MEHLQKISQYFQLGKLDSIEELKIIKQKTTLKPSRFVIVSSAALILLSFLLPLSPLIIAIGAVFVPAYFSLLTIGTKVQRDYIKYLIYWIVFGLFQIIIEPILSIIFHSTFIMLFQLAIVFILLNNKFNGSLILYDLFAKRIISQAQALLNGKKNIQKSSNQKQE